MTFQMQFKFRIEKLNLKNDKITVAEMNSDTSEFINFSCLIDI